ncbi:hypothetical protein Barb4_02931 [Bacteroidales bacterium Barb4]|nr:hypothetical protein Barb4_02931 [Bacteroidales bacterium Barb4]
MSPPIKLASIPGISISEVASVRLAAKSRFLTASLKIYTPSSEGFSAFRWVLTLHNIFCTSV